ncbi:MAG: FAD-binding oxidoreductase, partial [Planctomycetaceae bacterium]|nr:FAD-binding oxidoreductase [Planctomycetaceae bacterium]
PARDMTITVEAGMTVAVLADILKAESQQLPIDPASPDQTISSLVAGNSSGPRRFGYGTMRDYLIGVEAVDGSGRVFHAGGRVVKNVAGYDLCRLLIGSRGSLAVISQVTLKVKPLAEHAGMAIVRCPSFSSADKILETLNLSETRPVILDVLNSSAARRSLSTFVSFEQAVRFPVTIVVGYEGSPSVVAWQLETVNDEINDLAASVETIEGIPSFMDFCSCTCQSQRAQETDVWMYQTEQLPSSVISTIAALETDECEVFGRAGNGQLFIRKPGHRPANGDPGLHRNGESQIVDRLQSMLSEQQGTLSVLKSPHHRFPAAGPQAMDIIGKLKSLFDPQGVLPPFARML